MQARCEVPSRLNKKKEDRERETTNSIAQLELYTLLWDMIDEQKSKIKIRAVLLVIGAQGSFMLGVWKARLRRDPTIGIERDLTRGPSLKEGSKKRTDDVVSVVEAERYSTHERRRQSPGDGLVL